MQTAHVDFETYSATPINNGLDLYFSDPQFTPLCMAYAIGDGPVRLWRLGQPFPADLAAHNDAGGTFTAHNASFEIGAWARCVATLGWPPVALEQWRCTMARARARGFPGGLDACAEALGLATRKDVDGKRLIGLLCVPQKDGSRCADREQLEKLYAYCIHDVAVERDVCARLYDLIPDELRTFHADLRINARGVGIDVPLVRQAVALAEAATERVSAAVLDATWGICDTAGQTDKLLTVLGACGCLLPDLRAQTVTDALDNEDTPPDAIAILALRQEGSKSSVAKLSAMIRCTSSDGRARGLFQYHGADTGRWTGRAIQLQNLPRTPDEFHDGSAFDPDRLVSLIRERDVDALRALCGSVSNAMSWSIRGMIVPRAGHVFCSVDYSNIEGRVLAWEAGEDWKLAAFRAYDAGTGPDLYKLSYARSFGVPVDDVSKSMRQIGKVQELALGYQGGKGAFAQMAINYGIRVVSDGVPKPSAQSLSVSEVETVKTRWREAHPCTTSLWRETIDCATDAVRRPGARVDVGPVAFRVDAEFLLCRLPSGRVISYPYPSIIRVPSYGWRQDALGLAQAALEYAASVPSDAVTVDLRTLRGAAHRLATIAERASLQATVTGLRAMCDAGAGAMPDQWVDGCEMTILAGPNRMQESLACYGRDKKIYDDRGRPKRIAWGQWQPYGGLIVENITQAIARDLLAAAILRLEDNGFSVVAHVHDEIVCEMPEASADLAAMKSIMLEAPAWAAGLPIAGDGWLGARYRK